MSGPEDASERRYRNLERVDTEGHYHPEPSVPMRVLSGMGDAVLAGATVLGTAIWEVKDVFDQSPRFYHQDTAAMDSEHVFDKKGNAILPGYLPTLGGVIWEAAQGFGGVVSALNGFRKGLAEESRERSKHSSGPGRWVDFNDPDDNDKIGGL